MKKTIAIIFFFMVNIVSFAEFIHWANGKRNHIELDKTKRVSEAPYLTADTFRTMCEHKFDLCSKGIDPSKVSKGDKIYIAADGIFAFIEKVHPKIQEPYILLSHEFPLDLPGNSLNKMQDFLNSEKLAAWFCQNLTHYENPKLFYLPLGIPSKSITKFRYPKKEDLLLAKKTRIKKDVFCLKMYHPGDCKNKNGIRESVRFDLINKIKNKSCCYTSKRLHGKEYYVMLARSNFVLCPRGIGMDTYRFYETLYAGSFPVVTKSGHSCFFRDLPVVILDSWDDLNEARLEKELKRIKNSSFNLSKINSEYWSKLFSKCQLAIRSKNTCTHILKEYK